jgi:hypothetical protein
MKSGRVFVWSILFASVATIFFASCGRKKSSESGDGQQSSQFTMSGQLAIANNLVREAASAPDVIYAIPAKVLENIFSFRSDMLKTFSVGSDGKFSASVDASQGDTLFVAFDSKAANRLDGVRGVLSLKDDSGSLMRIPAKEGKQAIDLGVMSADAEGKEFVSGKRTDDVQSAFSLDLAQMKELAKTDDSARQLINVAANIQSNGDYFFSKPYMVFNGNLSKLKDKYSSVSDTNYNGYGLYFISRWTGLKAEDFCNGASATKKLKLSPPSGVKPTLCKDNSCTDKAEYTTLTNANTGELKTEGNRTSCFSEAWAADGQFYTYMESRAGEVSHVGFNWGGGGYQGKMPAGVWVLEMDGAEVGRYDLKSADPLGASGNIVVYVPSVKATTDSSNKVTKIDVEWYLWNSASSSYEKVTDMSSFARNVTSGGVELSDYKGGCAPQSVFIPFSSLNSVPMTLDVSSRGAAFPPTDGSGGSSSVCESESISVAYTLNGVDYRFDFRPYYP